MNETVTETAPVEAASDAAPAKTKPKPLPKKKVAAKPAKAKASDSIRSKVFTLLKENPNGLTGPSIMKKLKLSGVPSLLKDEGMCEKPRIKRAVSEEVRGVLYKLTALGLKDTNAGKVDDNAAPHSAGKDWPDGR